METLVVAVLVLLAIACCVAFWWCVYKPVRKHAEHGHIVADFMREFNQWEHDRCK